MIWRGTVFSKTLEMATSLAVVGPKAPLGDEPFAVCYLLHGLCGGYGDFIDYSRLTEYAENRRVVFVMPEVGRSFYSDMHRGPDYFSYVAFELPDLCARAFNISPRREDVMVAGCSMGGYGALKCALARPELYGRCAAFSPPLLFIREGLAAMRTPEGAEAVKATHGERLYKDFQAIFGDGLEWRPECDLVELANGAATAAFRPNVFLACGDKDYFLADVRRFGLSLDALGISCVQRERPGGHDWLFFDEALREALAWAFPAS